MKSFKQFFFLAGLSIAILLMAQTRAFAQANCSVSGVPAPLRGSGLTELTGSIVLNNCQGAIPAGGVSLTATIQPNPAVITNSTAPGFLPTAAVSTTVGGVTSVVVVAGNISGNSVSFSLPATPAGSTLTSITIGSVPGNAATVGIRVNAFAAGTPSAGQISALLTVSGPLALSNSVVAIGIPMPALFESFTPGAAIFQGAPAALAGVPPTAGFAPATPAITATDTVTGQAVAANSIPVINITEGFGAVLLVAGPAANGEGGDTSGFGTRVLIQFNNLPANLAVYAPQLVTTTTAGGSLTLTLVPGADANGIGGTPIAGASPFTANLITGTSITYETTASNISIAEKVSVPLGIFTTGTPGSGTLTFSVFLAPISSIGTAVPTTTAPIPRFASVEATLQTPPGAPIISLSAGTVNFVTSVGSTPPLQLISISNTGGGILNWTAAISSITGGNWLTLSPTSSTANSNLQLNVNSASLQPGTYSATVMISAQSAINSPQALTVNLTVTTTSLLIVPSSLSFNAVTGSNPAPQQLTILDTGGGRLNWTATVNTPGGNWLSLSTTSGVTPSTVPVLVNASGLVAGKYQGTITVSAPGAAAPQTVIVTLVLGTPAISLNPTSLLFVTTAGKNPAPQTFTVQNSGGGVLGWTATAVTQSGGNWLSVGPASATAPSTVTVTANAAGLTQGSYTGTITISALSGSGASNSPQTVTVTLAIDTPAISQNGVVNGASFAPNAAVSPGSIASLFGVNLAATAATASTTPLPTTLAGTQVLLVLPGGNVAVPLFYVSPTQINFELPPSVTGPTAQVVVVSNGVKSLPVTLNVASTAPGIFTLVSGTPGPGAVLNQDFSPNSAQNPAKAGSVILIYATGLGATIPPAVAGQPAGISPLSVTAQTPVVTIGGVAATVQFAGLAPNFVGLYQINAQIPAGTAPGNAVPVQIQIGGAISNTVTVAVQ